jgi:hypothetical protein
MELTRTVGNERTRGTLDQSKHKVLMAFLILHNSVVDRHHFYNDPDPIFHYNADPDPDPDPTLRFIHDGKSELFKLFFTAVPIYIVYLSRQRPRYHNNFQCFEIILHFWKKVHTF